MSNNLKRLIVPSHEELSSVNNNLKCTEPNCDSVFKSSSNLMMHLAQHHKIKRNALSKQNDKAEYACPAEGCKYAVESTKYFSKLRFLKQHYLKCHSQKSFKCQKCSKGFSTLTYLRVHSKACGKKFICSCKWEYTSREALLTHCKRKSHVPVDDENKTDGDKESRENTLVQVCISSPPLRKNPTHLIAAIALSELSTTFIIPKNSHIGVQTVESKHFKKIKNDKKRKSSQETQTVSGCKVSTKTSAETQTSGKLKKKSSEDNRKYSKSTQTNDLMPFLSSVDNESLDYSIFNESSLSNSSLNNDNARKTGSSMWSSESKLDNSNKSFIGMIGPDMFNLKSKIESHSRMGFNHNQTQTDIDSLLQGEAEGTSTIETQTTDDLFVDMYSNICTQTCSDENDLFDFNFVDIETQTAWPDL